MTISLVVFLAICVCFPACVESETDAEVIPVEENSVQYSFFVAGHVYGNPLHFYPGLFKSLLRQIPFFEKEPNLEFGVFTGDVVPEPTPEFFDSALVSMGKFPVPIKIAPGNHDRGEVFNSYFPEYFSESVHGNLHIYLAADNWQIVGKQLEFFQSQIARTDSFANVFIFVHELLWWKPDNQFGKIRINWEPHYNPDCNFWEDIHPALDSLSNDVFLIAGDLGGNKAATPFMYHKEDNITYIASGMGGRVMDNLILVDVMDDQSVRFRHYEFCLEGVESLPDLTAYELP